MCCVSKYISFSFTTPFLSSSFSSVSKTCGKTTRENCSYLIPGNMFGRSCSYTVCPSNIRRNQICRIRYDFESFQIAGPQTGTTRSAAATIPVGDGGAIGDCIEDAFSISSPSGPGSPVICGTNTGYHSRLKLIFHIAFT